MKTKQPRKQRKRAYTASVHERRRRLNSHLSRELRKELKKRSALVRKGDRVRVMSGEHKGATGAVTAVDYGRGVVFVEGVFARKQAGSEKPFALKASNLLTLERVQKKA